MLDIQVQNSVMSSRDRPTELMDCPNHGFPFFVVNATDLLSYEWKFLIAKR